MTKQDLKLLLNLLEDARDFQDNSCGESGCMCDLHGKCCSQKYEDGILVVKQALGKIQKED